MSTLIICEAGSCHDGHSDRMMAMVRAAAHARADVFKIQFWSDPDELAERRRATPEYREIYRRYAVPQPWLGPIKRSCAALGMKLGITTYLPKDVPTVAGVADYFKIASFEAEARDLIDAHRPFLGPIELIISLGMGARQPPMSLFPGGTYRYVRFLRCVSAYPAPVEALELARFWPEYDEEFDTCEPQPDGLSDHTDPALTWTGALAVAAGARIIEAHMRHEATDPQNPDYPHAMVPQQFSDYVRHIRFAETCVGTPDCRAAAEMHPSEALMARFKVRNR